MSGKVTQAVLSPAMTGPYPWACFHHRARSNPLPAYHRHNEVEMTFLYDGRMIYEFDGERTQVPNRRLCLFWGGISHRCASWGGRGGLRVICLPVSFLLQSRLPRRFLKNLLSGKLQCEPDSQNADWDEQRMQLWEHDIHSRASALLSIAASEIEARLCRMALCETSENAGPERGGDALSRLLAVMCSRANEPLTVSEMASLAGLHPKYAFRLFKSGLGITALEYLHRLRISHAQRLLATTDWRVTRIAFESGFNSASQFYQSFQTICGISPGQFRRGSTLAPEKLQG